VLIFVVLGMAVLAAGMFVMSRRSSLPAAPTATAVRTERAAEPPPARPAPATPTPEAKAPGPSREGSSSARASAAPRPRPAAPAAPAAADTDGAMLTIDADVPGAQVFVDRVFVGKTPITTTDVKVGSHRLNVSAAGYDGVAQTLDVKPGMQQVTVKLREVRLNARIDVVHKHRMGSCRGTLVATPRGITYETTDKDDAFKVALADLEEFQVDYLEKNLRLHLKRGKRYDFTDPDGNADRLFVFHRDVTQARDRLAKGDTPAE
jgi:hypothetical protein